MWPSFCLGISREMLYSELQYFKEHLQSQAATRQLKQSSLRRLLKQHKRTTVFFMNVLKKKSPYCSTSHSLHPHLFVLLFWAPPPSGGRRCVRLHCLNRAHRKGERADVMLIKVESGEEESAAWMLKLTHTHTQAQTIIGWIRTVQISFMCGHTHTLHSARHPQPLLWAVAPSSEQKSASGTTTEQRGVNKNAIKH